MQRTDRHRFLPSSKRARSAFAGFAAIITLMVVVGIDRLAGHYHAARQAVASEATQPA